MKKILILLSVLGASLNIFGQEKDIKETEPSTDSVYTTHFVSFEEYESSYIRNITNIIYIQNETITENRLYEASTIMVGTDVNPQQTLGNVTIALGKTTLKADTTIISGTTTIELGAELEIDPF